jgi:hypothetical protein
MTLLPMNLWSKVVIAKKMPTNAWPNIVMQKIMWATKEQQRTQCQIANDDSLLSEEDDDPNNLSFDDDIFGFDLMLSLDGMNDPHISP